MNIDLIYCASGNRYLAKEAIESGWLYGSQPHTIYYPIDFADLDFKRMDASGYLDKYKRFIKHNKPALAVTPDVTTPDGLPSTIQFAEQITQYVETVIIVPKVSGLILDMPKQIENIPVRLGYSVRTRYGGTTVPLWEFTEWPHGIHLLGGSPHRQLELANYLPVRSADCNYHQRLAWFGKWWCHRKYGFIEKDPRRKRAEQWFRISCDNIREAWDQL